MKKIPLLLALLPALGACASYEDLLTNPNQPTQVNPALLLTNIGASAFQEVSTSAPLASRHLAYTQAADASQYYGWQQASFGRYNELLQVHRMMLEAERIGAENYIALGKFFRAYYFHELTQIFGDIPYSQALQGDAGNFAPAYDSQRDVYVGILNELEEANALLHPDNGAILGDVIYAGDILKWRKLVNSFRLRVLLSLSAKAGGGEVDVVGQFQAITGDPARYPIFTSNADQAQLVFHDLATNRYPLFNNLSVKTDYFLEESFASVLKDRADPRLFAFAAPERRAVELGSPGYETDFNSYGGLAAGASVGDNVQRVANGEGSPIDPRYYSDPVNEPSIAVGYAELEFNLAEAAQRGWITDDPATHYQNGIRASMEFYGVPEAEITAYLAHPLVVYDPANGLQMIGVQKHIAFFMNAGWEPFYDQRRTGYPAFAVGPATQNGGQVPKRWMYPQSEIDRNRANLTAAIARQYGSDGDDVNGIMWSLK